MLDIHDIKPLEPIPDYSFYVYCFVITLICLLGVAIVYGIYKFFTRKKNTIEKSYYQKLQNIDLDKSKEAAYTISKYGRLLAKSDREKILIEDIYYLLEPFKYKKDVDNKIPQEVITKFETFMESVDVK